MRLGIDAREIQDGVHTGIGWPLANFLDYFSKLDNDDECILFSSKKIPLDFGPKVKNVIIKEWCTLYWDQIELSNAIKRQNIEILYSPYYKIPLLAKCKVVNAILDLMYLEYEEYKRDICPFKKLYYLTVGRLFVKKADKILTCSEYSKNDIIKIYKLLDL